MAELVLALDARTGSDALRLLDRLESVQWVKVGAILFAREGPDLVTRLVERGLTVFLDLKWHDIPHTVREAVGVARELGVSMATVHCLGGAEMMAAAAESAGECLSVVGVTVLTSHTPASYGAAIGGAVADLTVEAIRLGRSALAAGLSGLVCSATEARAVRQALPAARHLVVPGIRRGDEAKDDQSRTATPQAAIQAGATHLVVGRPVLQAADPAVAWAALLNDLPCDGP